MTAIPPTLRRPIVVLAAALVVLGLAACDDEPSSPTPEPAAFDGRLLVHTGRPEANQLLAIDGRGTETAVAAPDGGLRWFAAAVDGQLAGIDPDGALVVAAAAGEPWRTLPLDAVPTSATPSDIRLPAWSPDGRLAVVFGDAASATIAGVLVVDPATGGGLWIDLAAGLGGYPPAWLDGERLAVPTREAATDEPTIAILVVDTGQIASQVANGRVVAASPDRSTLAVLTAAGVVELWRPADWIAGEGEPILDRIEVGGSLAVDAIALDATGDRLAIGATDPDGDAAGVVRILDGTEEWDVAGERSTAAGAPISALGFVP